MGFGSKCRFWIRVCISSASYSLLINGMRKGIAKGQWGIRQGDPKSVFLFNIVMELLSLLVSKAEGVVCLSGWGGWPFCSIIVVHG